MTSTDSHAAAADFWQPFVGHPPGYLAISKACLASVSKCSNASLNSGNEWVPAIVSSGTDPAA